MKSTIAQFIPIVVIFLLLSFSEQFVRFTDTALGRILFIATLVFYTILDNTVGVFVAVLAILYYQSDFTKNMLNKITPIPNNVEQVKMTIKNIEGLENKDETGIAENTGSTIADLDDAYNGAVSPKLANAEMTKTILLDDFRQEYCVSGKLMYKNMDVKDDMIEHVFPEIKFNKDDCNPCAKTCDFSILENRLKVEKELIPKNSSDN